MKYIRPLFPYLLLLLLLLSTSDLSFIALINTLAQTVLFTFVVCIPIYRTGRMSYVDIAWPWGLVLIGITSFIFSDGYWLRSLLVSGMVILVGFRMGFGAVKMWRSGYLKKELPRYEYQHIRWKKKGKDNTQLALQVDAISQGLANASFLALPIFITASNIEQSFGVLEIIGICIWGVALIIESVADFQKLGFLKKMKKTGMPNQVCSVGLWKYSRHPNYFAEWMVWNGLVIMAIPSWLALKDMQSEFFNGQVDQILWLLLGAGLIYVSRMMYITLVYATGAIPAEYFSVQKRPDYENYQRTTNRFFPGPTKHL
jgi:steroid 5-alpha reductase family enzyme